MTSPVVEQPRVLTHLRSVLAEAGLSEARPLVEGAAAGVELGKVLLLLLVTATFHNIFRYLGQITIWRCYLHTRGYKLSPKTICKM